MPIVFGLACSHAPGMHVKRNMTNAWLERAIVRTTERGNVIPAAATRLTTQDLDRHWLRFREDHAVLKTELERSKADAVILVGGGRGEMFETARPASVAIFTGPECYGYDSGTSFAGSKSELDYVRVKTDVELAQRLAQELSAVPGLDTAPAPKFKPGGPALLQDDFANPPEAFPRPDFPTVVVCIRYGDDYNQPMKVTAQQCYDLGVSIARILSKDDRKYAIFGSGGLSHDPGGPRNLWIDEPLDNWFLDKLTKGQGSSLTDMWEFDSMTLRGGTREMAAWLTAAGAMEYMGQKATVVDYIPAPETQTGCGFAYWKP